MADPNFLTRTVQAVRYAITGVSETWMGPQQPLVPQQQQVIGRQYDYPVSYNVNLLPRSDRRIKFPQLKALSENCGVMRTVIERQKDLIESFDWSVKLRETGPGKRPATGSNKDVLAIEAMLRSPDRKHDWSQWLRALLHQVFVYDALTIYRRRDMVGRPYAFELVDGATIKPLMDASGRQPDAPNPAYQQRLRGVPAVDYTTDDLLYWPKNVTVDSPYGCSPVEQIIEYVETFIERTASQKAWFTEGNLADGFFVGPPEWKSEQLKVVAGWWDSLYGGNVRQRRKSLFLPNGSEYKSTKGAPLKDEFDEWLARVVCFAFSTSPQPFIKQVSRGNQESQQEVAEEGGVAVYMQFVKRVIDRLLTEDFSRPDLEFVWSDDREFDPLVAAQIDDIRLKNGSRVINEVRDNNGEDPIEGGDTPLIITAGGAVTLDSVLNPPEPVAPVVVAHPGDPAAPQPKVLPAPKGSKAEKLAKKAARVASSPAADRPTAKRAKTKLTKALTAILAKAGAEVAHEVKVRLMAMGKTADDAGDQAKIATAIANAVSLQRLADLEDALNDALSDMAEDSSGLVVAGVGSLDAGGLTDQVFQRAVAWAKAHAAGLVSVDGDDSLVASTRSMLADLISAGLADNLGSAKIADTIETGAAFGPDRAELIAKTEIGNANSQGALQGIKIVRDAGVKIKKTWEADAEACDICLDNEAAGAIDPDDVFPSGDDAPLAHPRCLPGSVLVATTGAVLAASKRLYDGNLVVIRTAGGKELACTPNHPVLTDRGWVAAGSLHVGGHVISDLGREWVSPGFDLEHQYVPARIEDIAEALGRAEQVTAAPVPIAAEDFHGDGVGSKVAVVWANRLLLGRLDSARREKAPQLDLVGADVQAAALDGGRVLEFGADLNGLAAHSGVRGSGPGAAAFSAHARVARDLGLRVAADRHASTDETTAHRAAVDAKALGDGLLCLAGDVAPDEIVDVEVRDFHGHVFNLQTTTGWYVAAGIITHNCECVLGSEIEDDA